MDARSQRIRTRRQLKPRAEALEERKVMAAPAVAASVVIPGAESVWNYTNGGGLNASAVASDIDGDGRDEIIIPGGDFNLYAYGLDPNSGQYVIDRVFSTAGRGDQLQSTPVVVDMPNGTRAVFAGAGNGLVFGWDARTGALLPGWPSSNQVTASAYTGLPNNIYGGLAAGDLDGDGSPEILATSINHAITAFRADGSVLWQFNDDDSIHSTPVIGDLDRDGTVEVVFGGDSSDNDFYRAGGFITALSNDGRREWTKRTEQAIVSSPALADLNADGYLDVVIGTGINFPNVGNRVYAIDRNGNDLPGWPYLTDSVASRGQVYSSPAIADLDGDGSPEVVVGDSAGRLHAIRANGQALWVVQAAAVPIFGSPIIADADGDGRPDVILGSSTQVKAYHGGNGSTIFDYLDPTAHERYFNSGVVGNFAGNGDLDLAFVANTASPTTGLQLSPGVLKVFDLPRSTLAPPWGAFRQDSGNRAILRNEASDAVLVDRLYNGTLGRGPTGDERAAVLNTLRRAGTLLPTIQGITSGDEARNRAIDAFYRNYLNRAPDPGGRETFLTLLRRGQGSALAGASILASDEAFNLAGGNNTAWVNYLYQKALGRTAGQSEAASWIDLLNANPSRRGEVAYGFFFSREFTENEVRAFYRNYGLGAPAAEALAAAGFDLRRGRSEEAVAAAILDSNGEYVNTQVEASYVRSIYRDVLGREVSPAELVAEIGSFEAGGTFESLARRLVDSHEAHDLLVSGWYGRFFSRASSAAERAALVAQLDAGLSNELALNQLFQNPEYFALAGGTSAGYVNKVFNDLLAHGPTPAQLAFFTGPLGSRGTVNAQAVTPAQARRLRRLEQQRRQAARRRGRRRGGRGTPPPPPTAPAQPGTPLSNLPTTLIRTPEGAFDLTRGIFYTNLRRFFYTPTDGSALGSRTPNLADAGQPFINNIVAGGNSAEVRIATLASPEYQSIARNKSFWNGTRWFLNFPV